MTPDIDSTLDVIRRKGSSMMKTVLAAAAMGSVMPAAVAAGQQHSQVSEAAATQHIVRASTPASEAAPEDHFAGRVHVERVFPATREINASGAYVTFEPGAHSAWHAAMSHIQTIEAADGTRPDNH